MSDMGKAADAAADFNIRDLNRRPAAVLAACDRLGVVRIRSRKGRTYELRTREVAADVKPAIPDFAARRKALGMPMMTKKQRDLLDKLIAGE